MISGNGGESAAATCSPSSFGICTSRNTTSGCVRVMASIASAPSPASPITLKSGAEPRKRRILRLAGRSSSTSRTRMDMVGNLQRHDQPAIGRVLEPDPLLASVKALQAPHCVGEADAVAQRGIRSSSQTWPVIAHLEAQNAVVAPGVDPHVYNG